MRRAVAAAVLAFLDSIAVLAAKRSALAIALSPDWPLFETDCSKVEAAALELMACSARAEAAVLRAEADLALATIDLSSLEEALILEIDSAIATAFEAARPCIVEFLQDSGGAVRCRGGFVELDLERLGRGVDGEV